MTKNEFIVVADDLRKRVEQLEVQLAGCLVAAEGHHSNCKQGDYGWSAAYAAVLNLRRKFEIELRKNDKQKP